MSVELDPDAALMLRVKQGDTGAFSDLVDKYKQPIMGLVFRMLRDATEADELIITTITHDHLDRVRSYRLLAEEWARR